MAGLQSVSRIKGVGWRVMARISSLDARFVLSKGRIFTLKTLEIAAGECWAFIGSNGSGKSTLARILADELIPKAGVFEHDLAPLALISLERLQALLAADWQQRNSDWLLAEEEDGWLTRQLIQAEHRDAARCEALAAQFGIAHLLERPFHYLSTGETRKVMLCQALMAQPRLLVLDEPFEGLDQTSRRQLADALLVLKQSGITLILILNRIEETPEWIGSMGLLESGTLLTRGSRQEVLASARLLAAARQQALASLPLPEADSSPEPLAESQPLVILRQGRVSYGGEAVIEGLDWRVTPGEHWHLCGANGAGKSTLLSLVCGDHPQGYANDLTLFGRRRGSGETIWEIKRHIGLVSSSLHQDYRVNCSALTLVLSGFYDSIGLYERPTDRQRKLALAWLTLLGMAEYADRSFQQLSWGQQRLLLIVRAMVKHPALLILDEPLQGLDAVNRQLVRHWISLLVSQSPSQLLFVSHHPEDAPDCISHRLTLRGLNDYLVEVL